MNKKEIPKELLQKFKDKAEEKSNRHSNSLSKEEYLEQYKTIFRHSENCSFKEIGNKLNLTAARIRQIAAKIENEFDIDLNDDWFTRLKN